MVVQRKVLKQGKEAIIRIRKIKQIRERAETLGSAKLTMWCNVKTKNTVEQESSNNTKKAK